MILVLWSLTAQRYLILIINFHLKMEKSFGIFTQALICMIMGLPFIYCWTDNVPRIDVTCDSDVMKVRFIFQRPFKGMVYANEFPWNPACSFQVPLSSSVENITLRFPYASCGTHIDYVSNGRSVISNTIRVQKHRVVKTVNDTTYPVSCTILGLREKFSKLNSKNLCDEEDEDELNIAPSLELSIGQDLLGSNLASELHLFNEPILVFRAKNTGRYQDMNVKSCIIHENKVLGGNSLIFQLTRPSVCEDLPSDIISTFSLFNATASDELVAFAKLRHLGQLSLVQNIHITCGAQLCRKSCKRKCSKTAANDLFTAVATHRISKRSLGEEIEQSSKQSSDLRDKLLKATVSILNNKFFQRLREVSPNNRSFHKRSEDDTEKYNQESLMTLDDLLKERTVKGQLQEFNGQTDQGAMPSEIFQRERNPEAQPREARMDASSEVSDTETSPSLSTEVLSKNLIKLSKDSQKGAKKKLTERNRTIMKDLARKLASRSQKLKEHNEKFRDLIKIAKEENFPLNGLLLKTPDTAETILTDAATNTEGDQDSSESVRHKSAKIKRSKPNNFEVTTSTEDVTDSDQVFITEEEIHIVTHTYKDSLSTSTEQGELKQSTDAFPIISVIEDLTNQPTLVQTIPQELFPLSSTEPPLIQDNSTGTIPEELSSVSSTELRDTEDHFSETLSQDNFPVSSTEPPDTQDDFSETSPQELPPISSTEPNDFKDNVSNCKNKSSEVVSTDTENIERLSELQKSYNVSHNTFIVTSIIMGLVIFVLIGTVIALSLQIKKEKKRHAIDNFLLYNFY